MPFDPTIPHPDSEMRSEEMRDQFNGLKTLIDDNIPAAEKGAADGVASLDSNGACTNLDTNQRSLFRSNSNRSVDWQNMQLVDGGAVYLQWGPNPYATCRSGDGTGFTILSPGASDLALRVKGAAAQTAPLI